MNYKIINLQKAVSVLNMSTENDPVFDPDFLTKIGQSGGLNKYEVQSVLRTILNYK